MLILLSPAKTLDLDNSPPVTDYSQPIFTKNSRVLVSELTKKTPQDLVDLMNISPKLAELNVERYKNWNLSKKSKAGKQAIFTFLGDVYAGFDATSLSKSDIAYAQKNLRILSGLYGVLKPLDLMQAYRLEMGTKISISDAHNLYAFWGTKISEALNHDAQSSNINTIVNLASNEYFKSVDQKVLTPRVITPIFKDEKNDKFKIISFYAKKARGMMARYLVKKRATKIEQIQGFSESGYYFSKVDSTNENLVFLRNSNWREK